MLDVILGSVLEQMRQRPDNSVTRLIVVPGEDEDVPLDEFIAETYRIAVIGGEVVIGRTFVDALELISEKGEADEQDV